MPTGYNKFQDVLPDPAYKILQGGFQSASGLAGPAFASVTVSSSHTPEDDRTISGRLIRRFGSYHKWFIDITYNPMTRAQFEPIHAFLAERRNSLQPFYVALPQYAGQGVNTTLYAQGSDIQPGVTQFLIDVESSGGGPEVGDIFNIADLTDSNHRKTYQVTRVETNTDYLIGSGQPGVAEQRIHFTPGLQKYTDFTTSSVTFANPLFRVIQKGDTQEYSLDADNLYYYSLKLEEVLY